jgi:hypothetical protein
MSSKLSKLPAPPTRPPFLSDILSESVPLTDELEYRLESLEKLKSKHSERLKHVAKNLHASEEEIRRIRGREKGKHNERIKREPDRT